VKCWQALAEIAQAGITLMVAELDQVGCLDGCPELRVQVAALLRLARKTIRKASVTGVRFAIARRQNAADPWWILVGLRKSSYKASNDERVMD
jgi:hypothetical protein